MLKRLSIFLFIALYFSSASGFAFNMHFCGQKLAKIQLNSAEPKSCCSKSAGETDHCCKNQKIELSISEQHQAVAQAKVPVMVFLTLFETPNAYKNIGLNTALISTKHFIKPPPSPVSIGLKNCIFRI